MIETILAQPGEITLVATGPLTNVAVAVRKAPRIAGALKGCVVMGGSLKHIGNMPFAAEYNVWCDPHAAHIVLHGGLPLTLVPLDVTYQCLFTDEHMRRLRSMTQDSESKVQNFIDDATRFYIEYHKVAQDIDGCAINDALALALTFEPDLVKTQALFVDVDLGDGPGHAGTFADWWRLAGKAPNMNVALEVDAPRFMYLFVERIARLARAIESG
jgi:purine nucleosidase